MYTWKYITGHGLDNIILNSDGKYLTSLVFERPNDKEKCDKTRIIKKIPIFEKTCKWLDIYFSGESPNFVPEYKILNITPFRKKVLEIIKTIPYGKTITYGDIARKLEKKLEIKKMSAQAVGGAVGSNPICLIIPCHRVVGSDGKIVGYGGGIENKKILLNLEKTNQLLLNIDKLSTTSLGKERIKKNLNINNFDVVEYLKTKMLDKRASIYKKGKNWYCEVENIIITINSNSYTIITAHKKNRD